MGFLILKHWIQDWNRTYCCSSNLLIYIMKFQDSKYITTTLYLAWAYFSTCWTRRIGLGVFLLFICLFGQFVGGRLCLFVFCCCFLSRLFLIHLSSLRKFLSLFLYWIGAKKTLLIWFQEWIRRAALHRQAKPDIQSRLATFFCASAF